MVLIGGKMVEYNIVKFCRLCKKRFVVSKREAKKYYCDDCQSKFKYEQEQDGGKK